MTGKEPPMGEKPEMIPMIAYWKHKSTATELRETEKTERKSMKWYVQFLSVSFNQDMEGAFLRQKGKENETEMNKAQENIMAEFSWRILVQILEKENRKKSAWHEMEEVVGYASCLVRAQREPWKRYRTKSSEKDDAQSKRQWFRRVVIQPEREEDKTGLNRRVWSWLRTNAGGVLNTCKSSGDI